MWVRIPLLPPQGSKGLIVESFNSPALKEHTVFLRGSDRSRDREVVTLKCENRGEAIRYFNALGFALKNWSRSWEGFKEDAPDNDDDTFSI